jgi:hypothetical protein
MSLWTESVLFLGFSFFLLFLLKEGGEEKKEGHADTRLMLVLVIMTRVDRPLCLHCRRDQRGVIYNDPKLTAHKISRPWVTGASDRQRLCRCPVQLLLAAAARRPGSPKVHQRSYDFTVVWRRCCTWSGRLLQQSTL